MIASGRRSPLAQVAVTAAVLCAALIAIAVLTSLAGDRVFERVVTVLLISVVLTVALQLFMGNSGLSSFGHIGFMAIGAYSSLWFTLSPDEKNVTLPDMPPEWPMHGWQTSYLPAILLAGGVAALVGALLGVALVRLRGASFTIATFAFLIIVHSVALQWEPMTRGSRTVFGIPELTTIWWALGAALITVIAALLFKESSLGLRLRAARDDEDAAASLGVHITWVRWVAWVVSVFITGAAGALWGHFITTFSPTAFYISQTFLIVAMLIIGGAGSVSGAVTGAVVVALSSEWLRRLEGWLNTQRADQTALGQFIPIELRGFAEIVIAIAMILVLILRPSGIMGGREIGWRWVRAKSPDPNENPHPNRHPEGTRPIAMGEGLDPPRPAHRERGAGG
ncbi:MAG: inner-rane translocator [Thermomicrobiales bacterium]|jgi:branched-chain amino acid transport system permease protein|nr:inner-rane translocator [Thermomicrobiales bacterium]MDF3038928.1 inner-rane translocator [Thermomicrobiales bacterium]